MHVFVKDGIKELRKDRRMWCFELMDEIDFSYSKEIEIKNFWAQAYHLAYYDLNFNPELTLKYIMENEELNKK